MPRFITSTHLPPSLKRKGFAAEVVDTQHPSDGGPVAVAWFFSLRDARADASRRNTDSPSQGHRPDRSTP